MIEINDFLEKNMPTIKNIITKFEFDKEFSSHDFIEKFIEEFESEYIEMLVKHQHSGRAFKIVRRQIARYLSSKTSVLHIEKTEKKESENVKGNLSVVQWWIRIR